MITVITTINPPNQATKLWEKTLQRHEGQFLVVGDQKTPEDLWKKRAAKSKSLRFLSLKEQQSLYKLGRLIPPNSYARKNLGYLIGAQKGEVIHETDDDNFPEDHWKPRNLMTCGFKPKKKRWINAYQYFRPLPSFVWPRGFPLEEVAKSLKDPLCPKNIGHWKKCPVQQGLAQNHPDVDAIQRLVSPSKVEFTETSRGFRSELFLPKGAWCPTNSQNTWWWPVASPLMYLPSFCSMRYCDILRGFVALRCLEAMNQTLMFFAPDVRQERNPHNLLNDFAQELALYTNTAAVRQTLEGTKLGPEPKENLLRCYQSLAQAGLHPHEEIPLVKVWCEALP
jgi:hypothetical protein